MVSLNYDIAYTQLTFHIQNNLTITLFLLRMQIIFFVEYYNRVAENYLELASTQRLHLLFKLMERSRKRIEPMAKELGTTKQEVHRNLIRLENSGLISKGQRRKIHIDYFWSCLVPADIYYVILITTFGLF